MWRLNVLSFSGSPGKRVPVAAKVIPCDAYPSHAMHSFIFALLPHFHVGSVYAAACLPLGFFLPTSEMVRPNND